MSEPNTLTTTQPITVVILGDPFTLDPGTYPISAENLEKYLITIPDGRMVVVMKGDLR